VRSILTVLGVITALVAMLVLGVESVGSFAADNSPPGRLTMLVVPGGARERALMVGKSALAAPRSERQTRVDEARHTIARYLSLVPTDGALWALQAQLAAANKPQDQEIADLLKMSYFTAPNDPQLMPLRLAVAVRTKALSDPVLETLAAGDVRAILLRRKDLADGLIETSRDATDVGRASLQRLVDAIDPQFGASLNAQR